MPARRLLIIRTGWLVNRRAHRQCFHAGWKACRIRNDGSGGCVALACRPAVVHLYVVIARGDKSLGLHRVGGGADEVLADARLWEVLAVRLAGEALPPAPPHSSAHSHHATATADGASEAARRQRRATGEMVVSVLPTHVIHPRMGWAKADATPVNTAMARSWGIIGGPGLSAGGYAGSQQPSKPGGSAVPGAFSSRDVEMSTISRIGPVGSIPTSQSY